MLGKNNKKSLALVLVLTLSTISLFSSIGSASIDVETELPQNIGLKLIDKNDSIDETMSVSDFLAIDNKSGTSQTLSSGVVQSNYALLLFNNAGVDIVLTVVFQNLADTNASDKTIPFSLCIGPVSSGGTLLENADGVYAVSEGNAVSFTPASFNGITSRKYPIYFTINPADLLNLHSATYTSTVTLSVGAV